MPAIQLRLTFEFSSDSDPEEIFNSVTEAFFDLEAASDDLHDADVTANLNNSTISLAIVGTGETIDDASASASSAIRAAIHQSGGATPGWNQTVEVARNQAIFRFLEETAVPA
jgi:hypothetical protein